MAILCLAVVLFALPNSLAAVELTQAEIANRRCLNCHGQSHIATLSPRERLSMLGRGADQGESPPAQRPELFLKGNALAGSMHASAACVDCHTDAGALPHPPKLSTATCASSCHSSAASGYLQGAHAEAFANGDERAPTCATCHGGHDILPKRQRESRTHPLNIVKTCAGCHEQYQDQNGKPQVAHYLESVHGKAVMGGGLAVAATCADCHGAHKVLPREHVESLVNRDNIATTCGKCHVGVSETYKKSVHWEQVKQGQRAAVCTDCHTAHQITRTDVPSFMLDIVAECGVCHDQPKADGSRRSSLYDSYRNSYHGQVTRLGSTRAARCSDCHGAHEIRRIEDPESRLNSANRADACRSCHPGASAAFALFEPHADHRDAKRYPLLHGIWLYFIIMMSAAFGFFGLHSVLWFGRSAIERIKHGPAPKIDPHGPAIQRFNRVDRINHAFVIISFFGLTLTGLPLRFSDQAWAQNLAAMLGGVWAAGILHRFFAIMLIGNFVVHFFGLANRIKQYSLKAMLFGPSTMLPRWKDIQDCLGMFRWFFVGGKKPKFDRWTYWEKFDYVAEVGGSLIIGVTGLVLWFPMFFSDHLPGGGKVVNVAKVIHGYEALLAIGFIFTIHFFNAHLRLEKFPVDDVMFTGRLPEEEFKHERGAEYERLVANGELDSLRVAPAPPWYRTVAVAVGLLAMAIGVTLVVLIILAGLQWM